MEEIRVVGSRCNWSKGSIHSRCRAKPTHIVKGIDGAWSPCCTRHVQRFKHPTIAYPNNPFAGLIRLEWKEWDFSSNPQPSEES